ncbi:IS3 family transposase [Collimonas humicola]|uniref:IS3 family transposase n=1 Tax=Collimonas humicola TaxID=2825886 RepID=UPI0038B3C2F3
MRYATHAEMKTASFEFIAVFYNRKRLYSTLGYRSPIRYLQSWTREQNQEKQAA